MAEPRKRRRHVTLSSKVLLIFIGAFILLGFLAWGFSKPWRGPWRDQMPKVVWINLRSHLVHVADELGSPPTEAKAREILKDLHLDVWVREQNQTLFSTTTDLPEWQDVEAEVADEIRMRAARPESLRSRLGDFLVGRTKGRLFAVVDRSGRQYVFFLPEREGLQAGLRAFSGFAFTIAFLLLIVLGVTNWLLRPMKPLMIGVGELSKGNLGYRVSIRARGEFRRVAEAFNDMADALQRQLKSKDQLLMDVSHELRSPLGRIKMAAEMLPPEHGGGDKGLRAQIQADVREMEDLVSELLEIYRLRESGESATATFTDVDLRDLARDVIGSVVQQKPGIEYRLQQEPAILRADEKQLKRAIRNVIENALKFSRHQQKPVEVTLLSRDGFYVLEIRDHGVGMTAEQSARIFEPFYRADSSRVRETGGFGLGLALAQVIVRAHGGTISCVSEADKGSVFQIQLPIR